jgi:outer membrane lipoprotein LolB
LFSRFASVGIGLWIALFGAGCATLSAPTDPLVPLYEQRLARLGEIEEWVLDGRLAINDGADGGSGQWRWHHGEAFSRMDFHGALGRGAWRLDVDAGGAELNFADGRTRRAESVDALVQAEVGWQVPIESLAWWVRGLAAPGGIEKRELDRQGRLSELTQQGWTIEYARYTAVGEEYLPMRMTARREDRTVKVAVRKWQLAVANGPR